jgi:hypothetical protein
MKKKIKEISKSLMFIIFCAIIVIIGISVDLGEIQPPQLLLNKAKNNDIYQTLIQVQASLAGFVLVVVSLLTSITKDKIYGMSVAKYVMTLKPNFPFRHIDIMLIEIILTAVSWICVALGLYNSAIAVFAIALFLIMLLICSVINVMLSSFEQEKEIYKCILENKCFEHIENLLKEISDSIASGDVSVFERDCIFAKKLIEKKFEKWSKNGDDANSFQRFFSTIILTAIRHNFSRSVDVLDLYILLLEQANKQVDGIFLIDKISYRDILDLLAIIPVKNVLEGNIMYRLQENHFINYSVQAEKMTGTTEDIVNYSAFKSTLSPRIFYYAGKECRAEEDETDELGKRIIENLQRLLEECKKPKNYIAKSFPETYEKNCQRYNAISRYEEYFENDYLTFIITLIKTI